MESLKNSDRLCDNYANAIAFLTSKCQVSETPELTEVVRQFIEANRAPRDLETDF
ncbi:hypothetical protein [Nostoc parmelioides]|uniref:Uncharacterized protein n=1 Tax=Nostoc parmelioides FACHB-3921 TaxID=2692909 RepID=A0ABR8BN78_9NOSO|nr:hypothetical protein [Nostoc parmelioides]MBD2255582.1 hypothetical protein [Nostoc parmelioides FACHB-3921]